MFLTEEFNSVLEVIIRQMDPDETVRPGVVYKVGVYGVCVPCPNVTECSMCTHAYACVRVGRVITMHACVVV